MTHITSTLLHLSDDTIRRSLKGIGSLCCSHYEISKELCKSVIEDRYCSTWIYVTAHLVIFEVRHSLIIQKHIITEDTDTHHTKCIAKSPVAPIVARTITCISPSCCGFVGRVLPGAIASTKETDSCGIPYIQHPLLKGSKLLLSELITHKFCCLCKLITI